MRRQTDRMTRIIEDLLELSRFEANEAPVKGTPIDVAAMAAMLRKDVLARLTHPRQVGRPLPPLPRLAVREQEGMLQVFAPTVAVRPDGAAGGTPAAP